MKYLLISILTLSLISDPLKIGKINSVKKEAREAYTSGDYKTAIAKYRYLVDSLDVNEDEILLNLANAYYLSKDTAQAYTSYQSLIGSTTNEVRSKAQQQLGIMNHQRGKLEDALNNFKQAIKADPNNGPARYNYEMLKKKLDEQKKQQQQDQNKDQQNKDQQKKDQEKKEQEKKDQQNKDQQNKDQQKKDQEKQDQEKKDQEQKDQQNKDQQKKDQEQKDQKKQEQNKEQEQKDDQNKEKKDVPPQVSEKLQQMKISEEKAKMILEAMKNQEAQYLQQNKRKATKPRDKGKPDW